MAVNEHYTKLSVKKLAVLAGLLCMGIGIGCKTTYKTTSSKEVAIIGARSLERGEHLVMNMCAPCHYSPDTRALTGKYVDGLPRIAGKVYSSSLTTEAGSSMLKYTDAELAYLIRTGINRDGHFVPYMMRPNLADQDLNDIIVFLRSKNTVLQRPEGKPAIPKTRLTMVGKLGMRVKMHPQPYFTGIARPASSDTVALGKYLVDNTGCFHCHSKSATSLDYLKPERSKGYLAGGARFITNEGTVFGPNLTPDVRTGLASYTREDLRKVLQQGITKQGQHVKPPAELFPLSNEESDAIYAYLRTLPPKVHRVKGH